MIHTLRCFSAASMLLGSMTFGALSPAAAEESAFLGWGNPEFHSELSSDRPDFTEATDTIDAGHLQIEGGYTFIDEGNEDSQTAPELLLRFGLTSHSELRIGGLGVEFRDDVDGMTDLSLGTKFRLREETNAFPAISLIYEIGLPTGHSEISAEEIEPVVKLLWSSTLSEDLAIAGNVNFAARLDDGDRFFELSPSISFATAVTDLLGAYLEYFGIFPESGAASADEHYANFGLTFAVTSDFQLDARIGAGLNSNAADLFTGVGFAFRR